jgi:hypothetical protein
LLLAGLFQPFVVMIICLGNPPSRIQEAFNFLINTLSPVDNTNMQQELA